MSAPPDAGTVQAGGVGENLQARNLDRTGTGTVTNPRKIYFHNPTSAANELTNSVNSFTTDNTELTAATWGSRTIPRRTN